MEIGASFGLAGARKVTDAEKREHDVELGAKKTVEIPSNMLQRLDYGARTDGQPVYIGYAKRGTPVGTATWLLRKFTYTGSFVTLIETAYDSWTNRSGATYA